LVGSGIQDPRCGIRDPGSGMGKNPDPESGINIPDPQHWFFDDFFSKLRASFVLVDPDAYLTLDPDPGPANQPIRIRIQTHGNKLQHNLFHINPFVLTRILLSRSI